MKSLKKYLFIVTPIAAVLIVVLWAIHLYYAPFNPPYTYWLLPTIFWLISSTGHYFLARAMKGKPDQFMIYFLLATTIKLLLYLAILPVWYVLAGKIITLQFAGAFLALYLIITSVDLVGVVFSRKKLKKKPLKI